MLDLVRLQTLQRFSVCGTITATAVSLGYSPSAVSQQLTALERDIGAVLIERTARSAVLTDTGRLLAAHAVALLGLVEAIEADVAVSASTVRGRLTVSAIPNVAALVAAALAPLQSDYGQLDLVLRESNAEAALTDVAAHVSDLAIVDSWVPRPARPPEGLTRYRIRTETVGLAVPAADRFTAGNNPMSRDALAEALTDHTWLCAPAGHGSRIAGDRVLAGLRISPARRWEFEGLITVAELVAAAAGYAFLPGLVAATQNDQLRLIPLPVKMVRHIHALTRTSATRQPTVHRALNLIRRKIEAPDRG